MNEGQVLGQVFNLPEPYSEQVVRGGGGNGSQPELNDAHFGIPNAQYGLQATGNVAHHTAAYYQKLAGLRTFAQSMWKNYGIDVTKPDFSRPEAVAASEAFKMELGNAEATANQAKNSQEMLTASIARPNTVVPTSATQGGYYGELSPEEQAVDMNMTPASKETVQNASGDVENRSIMNEEQEQINQKLVQLRAVANEQSDPAIKAKLLQQADMIEQSQNLKLNPPAANNGGYGMNDPNVQMTRKYYLLANGSPEYYKSSGKFNSEGSQIGVSTVDKGTQFGNFTDKKGVTRPFVIEKYEFDPDAKELTVYADSKDAEPIKVKGDKILNFLSEIAGSNTGGIINGKSLRDALTQMNLLKGNDINGDRLLSKQEHVNIANHNAGLQSTKGKVSTIRQELSDELDNLSTRKTGGFGGDAVMHFSPAGKQYSIMKQDGKYFFTAPGSLYGSNILKGSDVGLPVKDNTGKPKGEYDLEGLTLTSKDFSDGLTKERMMEVLEHLGYTSKRLNVTPDARGKYD